MRNSVWFFALLLTVICLVGFNPIEAVCSKDQTDDSSVAPQQKSRSMEEVVFDSSMKNMMPLTPEQIKKFQSKVQETQEAIKIDKPPQVTEKTKSIPLQPGKRNLEINISPGYVSSVVFYDLTGEPWPITSVTIGNPNAYSVVKPDLDPGNMITISALKKYSNSNLIVTLKKLSMPISLQLSTNIDQADSTDSLISFRADQRGPMAKDPVVGPKLEKTIDDVMLSFLDFVPPSGADKKNTTPKLSGVDVWEYDGVYYIRSRYSLLWPAYRQAAKGVGGIGVYVCSRVPSFVVSYDGKNQRISVKNI